MATGFQSWSQTSATNATADSTINWAEGQAPSSVNDSARAMMAILAKWRDDNNGTLTTSGGTTAYTLTSNTGFVSLAAGNTIAFSMNATNGATVTLNVDSLGAKPLRPQAGVEFGAGALVIGGIYRAEYATSNSGEWIVMGVTTPGSGSITNAMLAANAVTTTNITASNVTYATIQNVAATRLLGNPTGSPAAPSEISVTGPLAFSGSALTLGSTNTAHGVALFEGTGAMGNTGPGTLGQSLVSNGASADPSFQSGGWVLLNTLTASTSASLQDTTSLTSSYNDYQIVFENLLPVSNSVQCQLAVHASSAYQNSGYITSNLNSNGATSSVSGPTTFIPCSTNNVTNASGYGISGTVMVYNPSSSSNYKNWAGQLFHAATGGPSSGLVHIGGIWTGGTAAIDGFQVTFSSGNISSGSIKIYGRL